MNFDVDFDRRHFGGRGCLLRRRAGGRRRVVADARIGLERFDQLAIVRVGLGAELIDIGDDGLDAVDGGQDQRDLALGRRGAVTQFADQGFGRVRHALQPVQAEKARRALDRVDQPENAGDQRCIARVAFEKHELRFDALEMFRGFGQEIS
jgi:hypothetical protein